MDSSPKTGENRKMWSFVIWLYFSLLILLVDERYFVVKVIRPVCLRQLGSVPISGVKLFLPLKFLLSKATFSQIKIFSNATFFLCLLIEKSLASFVHCNSNLPGLDLFDGLGFKT